MLPSPGIVAGCLTSSRPLPANNHARNRSSWITRSRIEMSPGSKRAPLRKRVQKLRTVIPSASAISVSGCIFSNTRMRRSRSPKPIVAGSSFIKVQLRRRAVLAGRPWSGKANISLYAYHLKNSYIRRRMRLQCRNLLCAGFWRGAPVSNHFAGLRLSAVSRGSSMSYRSKKQGSAAVSAWSRFAGLPIVRAARSRCIR
jgi:hypothetical protein